MPTIHTPTTFATAMSKAELPCQVNALQTIMTGLERYDDFHSDRIYIGRDRALPVFRALAARGWHVLWCNKWGDGRDCDQTNGKDVDFVVSAKPPTHFWDSRLGCVTTAYRVGPGEKDGEIVESGPFPHPGQRHNR